MNTRSAGTRLGAILWFIAAALAWSAVLIRYIRREEMAWPVAAAGVFFLVMGFSALKRSRAADSVPPRDAGTS